MENLKIIYIDDFRRLHYPNIWINIRIRVVMLNL